MLNTHQLQAVRHTSGPLMVIAGPGTGKTKTLVAKIEDLISKTKVSPEQILALTFTNKAAAAITERLSTTVFVGTFHAFCHHLLASNTQQSLKIITETERKHIINQLLKTEFSQTDLASFSLHEVSLKLSQLKLNQNQSAQPATAYQQLLIKLLDAYNFQLSVQQIIDFDDLLIKTVQLLQTNHQLTKKLSEQYQQILIDEFQDTHPIQYQIIKLLTAHQSPPNLTVIGDPWQSIYSFRGANSNIFQLFQQDFPQAKTITLTINYRSRPQIINLSHSLFPDSPVLKAYLQDSAQIDFVTTLNEQSESQWIINSINHQLGGIDLNQASDYHAANQASNFADFAIIFRTHHLAHTLETSLEKSGLPYQNVGGLSLFEKTEIAFLISAFNYLFQDDALTKEKLVAFSFMKPRLLEAINALRNQVEKMSLDQVVERLLQITKLDESISQSQRKQLDLQNFHQYLAQFTTPDWLKQSVSYFQHLQECDFYDDQADRITLLTMHAAKGLEFKHVFLIGFEAGLIPHQKRMAETEIEEEKRLLYVALTRAQQSITVINCQERFREANRHISPFMNELDHQLVNQQLDPQISKVLKYRQRLTDKKRQMSLF